MEKEKLIAILKALTQAAGVSGDEQEAVNVATAYLKPCMDRLSRDSFGNLIGFREGTGGKGAPSLLIAAHIDEVGAMVTGIEKGFIRFTAVGGLDPRTLPGQAVVILGRSRRVLSGASTTPADQGERKKGLKIEDMFIDLGWIRRKPKIRPG